METILFTYICLGTNNLARAATFYDATLGALGLARCDVSDEPDWDGWIGWGLYEDHGANEVALWLCPDFYAAYVRDPDGHKLAAICRGFTQP